jgi:hypothetical protein
VLPDNLDFYRTPISSTSATTQRRSPSVSATSAISAAAEEVARPQTSQKIKIHGSVTTTEIADNIRAVLARDGEGALVVLTPEDITVTSQEEEKDRVKHLGIFDIDIKIKGAENAVRRTIRVNAVE